HEVLWVLRDCLSGEVLLARSLLSATAQDLKALIDEVRSALPVPITGAVSDGQETIRQAVAQALPGVPHQLCQFHYLREAAKPIYEADRHATKELKKRVRGVRPIERAAEAEEDDAAADSRRGSGAAVRAAGRGGTAPALPDPECDASGGSAVAGEGTARAAAALRESDQELLAGVVPLLRVPGHPADE